MVDLKANILATNLLELIICMRCLKQNILQPFFSFLHGFDRKNNHTILALMLDLKFKSKQLVTSYLGHENASTLIV
jgi:hypothetical protein